MNPALSVTVYLLAAAAGMLSFQISSPALGQVARDANATPSPISPKFERAALIERYDSNGRWRPLPLKAELSAEQAERLAKALPELGIPPAPLAGSRTFERMRFQIIFTQMDGKSSSISINPEMNRWWDDRQVHDLSPAAAELVRTLAQGAKEDQSLAPKSPVVRVDIVDREDGYLKPRKVPLRAAVTDRLAPLLAGEFPELGLQSEAQMGAAGFPRFFVTFIRANGDKHEVAIYENVGAAWMWCEGQSNWPLSTEAAGDLLHICGDPKYAAPTTAPSTMP